MDPSDKRQRSLASRWSVSPWPEIVQEGMIEVGGSTEKFCKNWVAIVVFSHS